MGDHIRRIRLDRGLWQRQVAAEIGVDVTTLHNWETQRNTPSLRFMPRIIGFLGYNPYPTEPTQPLSAKLKTHRRQLGLSQERLAELLEVDESTVRKWEAGHVNSCSKYTKIIDAFLTSQSSNCSDLQ